LTWSTTKINGITIYIFNVTQDNIIFTVDIKSNVGLSNCQQN
jgi:hypothetical protein